MPEISRNGRQQPAQGVKSEKSSPAKLIFDHRTDLIEDQHIEPDMYQSPMGIGISDTAPPLILLQNERPELAAPMQEQLGRRAEDRFHLQTQNGAVEHHQSKQPQIDIDQYLHQGMATQGIAAEE
jgi:hypothetical protein